MMKRFRPYLLFLVAYGVLCVYMGLRTLSFLYPMMAFNAFLGTLPLVFIILSHDFKKREKKVESLVFLFLWLFFFPNALYMVTDFIHITENTLIAYRELAPYEVGERVIYSADTMAWLKLFVIGIGYFYATLVGLLSLDLFLMGLKKKGKRVQGIFLLGIAGLTGMGVYIGRFLRFNSWDIIAPVGLIKNLMGAVNQFSWEFSLIFSLYTLAIYGIYQIFKLRNTEQS